MSNREKTHREENLRALKKRRHTHLGIMADILKASSRGTKKTHLMYRCNLSFQQSKKYLNLLLQKGLIRPVVTKKSFSENLFKTTQKGEKFLGAYKNLKTLLTT